MNLSKPLIAGALSALLSTAALAQETATGSEETGANETTEATEAPQGGEAAEAVDPGLAMGEDASQQIGAPYAKEQIGDWTLQCLRSEDGNDPCQMYQLLADSEGNAVAEFTLFRLPEGQKAVAGAMIAVPLETLLSAQITIQVDAGGAKRYPFMFCNTLGCYARVGFTQADVNSFKRGNVAKLQIVPVVAPDQKVDLNLSLTGFTATYDKVTVGPSPQ